MKHLTILVPDGEGNNLSSIVGAYKIFSRANQYRKQQGNKELFKIELAGQSKKVDFYEGLFSVRPQTTFNNIRKTNLIIVPSLNHQYQATVKKNKSMIEWIAYQYKTGAEVASICTGAFLLAAGGLLNGRTCSTHWAAADQLRSLYPGVKLQADRTITDENGIYTNGGAYSFLNLVIYLVEKYFDRTTAIYCSKVFQIDMDRNSQSAFAIFTGQKQHGDDVVREAQVYMENRVEEKITMEELSSRFALSRRNFDRRFIKATGNTPVEYLQRLKVELAKKALEASRKSVQEIMYETGYADLKSFREVFRKVTGMSPLDYKKRYNKEAVV